MLLLLSSDTCMHIEGFIMVHVYNPRKYENIWKQGFLYYYFLLQDVHIGNKQGNIINDEPQ